MTSKTVQIHAEDFAFPGEMHKYYWQFPTILTEKKIRKKSAFTSWTIYVCLATSAVDPNIFADMMNPLAKGGKANPKYNPDFSFANVCFELKQEYLDHLPINIDDVVGVTVCEMHHQGSPANYEVATIVLTGKNLGRKNATNVFTQAMRDALSKYNKKINLTQQSDVIFPMLATGEAFSGDNDEIEQLLSELCTNYIGTGVPCQRKYDGIRCMVTLDSPVPIGVKLPSGLACYSRSGHKLYTPEHLEANFIEILNYAHDKLKLKNCILDGEIYNHDMHLTEISGYVRGEVNGENRSKLNFMLFDITFSEAAAYQTREATLRKLAQEMNIASENNDATDLGAIKLVETKWCKSVEECMKYYNQTLNEGYEGIMVRLPDKAYDPGFNNRHSKNLIKLKPLLRDEYLCVGYNTGKGKSLGEIVLICEIREENVTSALKYLNRKGRDINVTNAAGNEFSVRFKGLNSEKQKEMFRNFAIVEANEKTLFENKYKGRLVTLEFMDYSPKDLKPQRANAIAFR